MSTVSASVADLSEPNTARQESSVAGRRGVDLWLEDSDKPEEADNDTTITANKDATPSTTPVVTPSKVAGVSPSLSAAAATTEPQGTIEDQLKLLKEKRRQRELAMSTSARPSSKDSSASPAATPPEASANAGPVVPPIALRLGSGGSVGSSGALSGSARNTGGSNGSRGSGSGPRSGRPPLIPSARRQLVHVPRSGRDASPSAAGAAAAGPMSARASQAVLSPAELVKLIKDLNSSDWKGVQTALEKLRSALTASSSMNDETRVVLRQNLHGLVTGNLAAMESPRSSVAKFATDLLGLVCQKLGTRHIQQGDDAEGDEATAAAVGGSSNSLEHFVEPIVTKIVAKGGAASSRFLYDGALVALRELVPATRAIKVLAAAANISGVKTEKMKVLQAEGLTSSLEHLQPGGLRSREPLLIKVIDVAEHFTGDAHPDVREAGKRLARALAHYSAESREPLKPIIMRHIGVAHPIRAKEFLAHCAAGSTDEELTSAAASPQASARGTNSARAALSTPLANVPAKVSPRPPASGRTTSPSTTAGDRPPRPPSSERAAKPPLSPQSKLSPNATPRGSALAPPSQQATPAATLVGSDRHGGTSPIRNDSFNLDLPKAANQSMELGSKSPTVPSIPSSPMRTRVGASPRVTSPQAGWGEATVTNNSLFATPSSTAAGGVNSSFFQGTIGQDMRQEHGEFSQSIFLAAEGSSADRGQALSTLTSLLRRRVHDQAEAGASDVCTIANATCFALCDVVALRCADTSQKVQVAALELVPTLFRAVQASVVDATSPRWVSCLSTGLASSYAAVHSAASVALNALLVRSSEINLRNLCQTICMTCATVRNVNAKIELMKALSSVLKRNQIIINRDGSLNGSELASPMAASGSGRLGLTRSELDFSTETALRIWCGDTREEVRRVTGNLLVVLLDAGWDGDEGKILDNSRLDQDNWALIKALFDRHSKGGAEPNGQ